MAPFPQPLYFNNGEEISKKDAYLLDGNLKEQLYEGTLRPEVKNKGKILY